MGKLKISGKVKEASLKNFQSKNQGTVGFSRDWWGETPGEPILTINSIGSGSRGRSPHRVNPRFETHVKTVEGGQFPAKPLPKKGWPICAHPVVLTNLCRKPNRSFVAQCGWR
jgi:hypothetical protein